jgi:acyl carrier protein
MTPTEIETKVKDIVLGLVDVDEAALVPGARLRDLGLTSIDLVELVSSLESEFDVDISDDDLAELSTVQETVDYLRAKTA